MQLEDFVFDLRHAVTPSNHLFVSSGFSTVSPLADTVIGVSSFYSPPFAGGDLLVTATIEANHHLIHDNVNRGKGDCGLLYAGGKWYPDRLVRYGTYHHDISGKLLSLAVKSTLIPLVNKAGYVVQIKLLNRTDSELTAEFDLHVNPGCPRWQALENWDYSPPSTGKLAATKVELSNRRDDSTIEKHGDYIAGQWQNEQVIISLWQTSAKLTLSPQQEGMFSYTIIMSTTDKMFSQENDICLEKISQDTQKVWQKRLARATERLPHFISVIPELNAYVQRSMISGLICEWENPDFVISPFLTTSGIDGGAVCAYLWDVAGYAPRTIAQWQQESAVSIAKKLGQVDLSKNYALTAAGTGVGCEYAYSAWSFMELVWSLALFNDVDIDLYKLIRDLFISSEIRAKIVDQLVDFGGQHNLLEMRGRGYEGFTPSPNAERAVVYERLAKLAQRLHCDQDQQEIWLAKARQIRQAVIDKLWNKQAKWFDCLRPDGQRETVYSIQIYDVWRAGVDNPEIRSALLEQLSEQTFLGKFGVSSISAQDYLHYELNDPDWSGGGAYTGEAPLLALTLYECSQSRCAWDVWQRLLWMGSLMPYYPQEHYSDRPATPAHKRANVIAGLAGYELAIYGLGGFSPQLDGSLKINALDWSPGDFTISNFHFRNHVYKLECRGNIRKIYRDEKLLYSSPISELLIIS